MLIENKTWEKKQGRHGFQGQERDDEVAGMGNHLHYKARDYSGQILRMTGIDPLADKFPSQSPYITSGNNPIYKVDVNGEWNAKHHEMITRQAIQELVRDGEIEALTKAEIDQIVQGNLYTDDPENPINKTPFFAGIHSWVPTLLVLVCGQNKDVTIDLLKATREGTLEFLNEEFSESGNLGILGAILHIEQDPYAKSHGFDAGLQDLLPEGRGRDNAKHDRGDKLVPKGETENLDDYSTQKNFDEAKNNTKAILKKNLPKSSSSSKPGNGKFGGNGVGLVEP